MPSLKHLAVAQLLHLAHWLRNGLKGQHLDEAGKISNSKIAKELSLPPVKLHCSMLAEDAIKAAIADYKIKKESRDASDETDESADGSESKKADAEDTDGRNQKT